MNVCVETHEPRFQITYKSAKGRSQKPVWLVCDICKQNSSCFGSEDEIESIEVMA